MVIYLMSYRNVSFKAGEKAEIEKLANELKDKFNNEYEEGEENLFGNTKVGISDIYKDGVRLYHDWGFNNGVFKNSEEEKTPRSKQYKGNRRDMIKVKTVNKLINDCIMDLNHNFELIKDISWAKANVGSGDNSRTIQKIWTAEIEYLQNIKKWLKTDNLTDILAEKNQENE